MNLVLVKYLFLSKQKEKNTITIWAERKIHISLIHLKHMDLEHMDRSIYKNRMFLFLCYFVNEWKQFYMEWVGNYA